MQDNSIIIANGDNINGQDIIVIETERTFKDIKADFIQRCKNADACQPEFKRVLSSETMQQLLQVIKDNIYWCIQETKIIDVEYLEKNFGPALLWANNMYTAGEHHIEVNDKTAIVLLGSSSATVKTWGSSSATVKTCDSSSATVETWGSSSATVETWGSSSATVKTCDSSRLTYILGDGNCPTIKHLNEKKLYIKTSDFEIVQL